jgi:hypothetical protein
MTFVVRETPAWLDQHQTWISDGARALYKTLRSLADAKTGRLLIPGRGWISPRTIERKAGMHEETRLKYTRELKRLGAILVNRDHVIREIDDRKRWVWGPAQITVLPLQAQNPHKQRVSSTPGNGQNANPEPQKRVSSTPGFATPKAKKNLLHPESCGPQETGCQYSSKNTNGSGGGFGSAVDVHSSEGSHPHRRRQKAPAQKHDHDERMRERTRKLKIDPDLRRWATQRILARAGTVQNWHAYIRKALPEFLENIAIETEEHLAEQAELYYSKRLAEQPGCAVTHSDIYGFLRRVAQPIGIADDAMLERARAAAADSLRLTTNPAPVENKHQ